VYRIDGDHHLVSIEEAEKVTGGEDLVTLGRGSDLAEDHPGGAVKGGNEVRCRSTWGASTADGLAVQGDDPAPAHHLGASPAERRDHCVQDISADPGEGSPDRGLARPRRPRRSQLDEQLDAGLVDPLPDHGERSGPAQHHGHPHSQQTRQCVPHPARMPRVGHPPQQHQQIRSSDGGCGRDSGTDDDISACDSQREEFV
jgi:hypothetical protein